MINVVDSFHFLQMAERQQKQRKGCSLLQVLGLGEISIFIVESRGERRREEQIKEEEEA